MEQDSSDERSREPPPYTKVTPPTADRRVEAASEQFVTFLYAAAANLLLAFAVLANVSPYIVVAMIVFLLFDWLSRVRLPMQIPEESNRSYSLWKTFFEVAGVALLSLALIGIADSTEIGWNPYTLAGIFGIVTGCWNGVMLNVEETPSWTELFPKVWLGRVVDDNIAQKYVERFVHKVSRTTLSELDKMVQGAESRDDLPLRRYFLDCANAFSVQGFGRFTGQVVGFHLVMGNFVVGGLLIYSATQLQGSPVLTVVGGSSASNLVLAGALSPAAFVVLLAALSMVWWFLLTQVFSGVIDKWCASWPSAFQTCGRWAIGAVGVTISLIVLWHYGGMLQFSTTYPATVATFATIGFLSLTAGEIRPMIPYLFHVGGTAICLAATVVYVTLPSEGLFLVLASQQIVMTLFLVSAVAPGTSEEVTPESDAIAVNRADGSICSASGGIGET